MLEDSMMIETSHKNLSSHGPVGIGVGIGIGILDGALELLRRLQNLLLRLGMLLHIDSNIAGLSGLTPGTVRMLIGGRAH